MKCIPRCTCQSGRLTGWALTLLAAAVVTLPAMAQAQTYTWNCTDDYWQNTGCWSPTGTPTSTDFVYVYPVSDTNTVLKIDDLTGNAYANVFTIDYAAPTSTVTLQQTGSTLATNDEHVGEWGAGAFTQSGGTNTLTDWLLLGTHAGANGTYYLSGDGTLEAASEYVGNEGTGAFTQIGGTNTVTNDLYLGKASTATGTYTLAGGILSAGAIVNGTGSGTLNIDGGTLTVGGGNGGIDVDTLVLGSTAGTSGSHTLSGSGTIAATDEYIGASGTGVFTQSGGTNTITNAFYLGDLSTGNGTYNLSAGTLSAAGPYSAVFVGNEGTGVFTQSGGTHTVTNLFLGNAGNGTYDLSDTGSLAVGYEYIGYYGTGAFTQTGGTHTVTNAFVLGHESAGDGSYHLDGGTLSVTATDEIVGLSGVGAITQTGGTNTVINTLRLGDQNTGNGAYDLSGSGTLEAANEVVGDDGTGAFTQTGGSNTVTTTLYLGLWNTGNGTYDLSGTGSLSAAVEDIGYYGTGAFTQTGGTNTVTSVLYLGDQSTGNGTYTLAGGTLNVNSLAYGAGAGAFHFVGGTFNLTGDDLTIGTGGLFGSTVQISPGQVFNVTHTTTVAGDGLLYLNGGAFSAGNLVNNGQVAIDGLLSNLGGVINNNGLLDGDGRVSAVLVNNAGGEIQVDMGHTLRFMAAGNTNSGALHLSSGTARFDHDLTNASGGLISGRGTLIANGGLTNQGTLAFSGGTTDVYGDVNNANGGSIIVSGNGTLTFYDDLVHNGAEIRVSSGSSAVFFGAVSGAGSYTGPGSLFFEGDLNPGNSPALITTGGDLTLGVNSRTLMEIAGLARGAQYDAFTIDGTLTLGGELDVVPYDLGGGLFTPQLGESFDLFAADTITGNFDQLSLAALSGGLGWQLEVLPDAIGLTDVVRLSVVSSVPVPSAMWLFGSGLLGFLVLARRRTGAGPSRTGNFDQCA